MTSVWHAYGAAGLMNGSIDLDTSTLKAALLMTNTTADTEDVQYLSGFTTLDEMDGTGYARVTLTGGTVSGDTTNHRGEVTFSDIRFSGVGAGTRQVQGVLIYKHVGADSANVPIAYLDGDSAGVLPFTANGGDIVIASPAEGLLRVSR